jgi:hypothetical protein
MTATRSNGRTTPRKTKVGLDLDKLEREGATPEPFTFRHSDTVFTLADPLEMDYRDIVEMAENSMGQSLLIRRLLGDQYETLTGIGPLPQWKIEPLVDAWMGHYGLTSPGEANASPAS